MSEAVGGCVEEGEDVAEGLGVFEGHGCALPCLDEGRVVNSKGQ